MAVGMGNGARDRVKNIPFSAGAGGWASGMGREAFFRGGLMEASMIGASLNDNHGTLKPLLV